MKLSTTFKPSQQFRLSSELNLFSLSSSVFLAFILYSILAVSDIEVRAQDATDAVLNCDSDIGDYYLFRSREVEGKGWGKGI